MRASLRCLINGRGILSAKTITIDLDQREGLYEPVRNHLGSIEDFWLAMQREGLRQGRAAGAGVWAYRPRACSRFDW